MSEPREVVARAHAAANADDHEQHLNLYAEDALITTPGNHSAGRDSIGDFARTWQKACPDAQVIVGNQIVDGNMVAEEFTFDGTHTETLALPDGDIPATHRHLIVRGALFMRVEEGKIVSERVYLDELDIMSQLEQKAEAATA